MAGVPLHSNRSLSTAHFESPALRGFCVFNFIALK